MTLRANGSYIGPRASAVTVEAASGVWDLRTAQRQRAAAAWPTVRLDPATIAGLQLWLDASDSSTLYDATTGGSLVAADGAVARWEDKSGNGNHATQSASGSRPIRETAERNGLDVLRFDGSNHFFSQPAVVNDPTELTVIAVAYSQNGSQGNLWSHRGDSSSVAVMQLNYANDNPLELRLTMRASNFARRDIFADTQLETLATYGFVFNKAAASHYVFSNKVKGDVSTESFSGGDFYSPTTWIGSDPGTSRLQGDICELVLYNRALSDAERESVEDYLIAKWGIA